MPVQRECPHCGRKYPDTATLCTNPPCTNLPAAAPAALVAGTSLSSGKDNYEITKVLGWGGMATVYLTNNRAGDVRVVKEMLPNSDTRMQLKLTTLWKREATIQELLSAPLRSTPPAFPPFPLGEGFFPELGRLFMAMSYMEGEDLDHIQDRVKGPLPFLEMLQHGIEIAIVLRDQLHAYREQGVPRPIIHRDIKPANIHILKATGTACLLDFGIARFESFSAATLSGRGGTKAGTPAFAAPELLQRGKQISPASDIFCLCASIWALLANAKEFPDHRADQVAGIRRHVPDQELQAILIRGTDENPAGRYQTAEELRSELVRVYESHRPLPAHLQPPIATTPTAPAPLTTQPQPQAPTPTATAAVSYKIAWSNTPTVVMANGTEYQRDLIGKVLEHRRFRRDVRVPSVNVVVSDIVDSGGGHPTGVSRVLTDQTGYFHLDQMDTRVPIAVVERRLRIVVEQTNGQSIHDETIRIKRPRQIGQRLQQAAGRPFRTAGQRLGTARGAAGNFFGQANVALFGQLGMALFFLLVLFGIAIRSPYLAAICLWGVVLSARLYQFGKAGRARAQFWRMIFLRLSVVYVGAWLILLLAAMFGYNN